MNPPTTSLRDGFGREIRYLRISVTDRCDFRCTYCMAEDMTFLPRQTVLTLEEIQRVATIFTELGIRKIRITGGEPLVRRSLPSLLFGLRALPLLDTLAMTTNGSQLVQMAEPLKQAGVDSLNISIDTLDPAQFKAITRTGDLDQVLRGIDAAIAQRFRRIRLNVVALAGLNDNQILPLVDYALSRCVDIAFIEEMPLGQVTVGGKALRLLPSASVQALIEQAHELSPLSDEDIGGPARYFSVPNTDSRIGFISPHSNNFCHLCNRLRITADGRLLLCLGNEDSISLRDLMRQGANNDEIKSAIVSALESKPERHFFDQPDQPQIVRFMNMSGG